MSDEFLLRQFSAREDQSAFAELVQRHGPMVWGVCLRVLGHHQDAEEAFQATFLVLARKAAAVRQPALLANWLFGVAHRTAINAKKLRAVRQVRERVMEQLPETGIDPTAAWNEISPLIDEELSRLPDAYRAAVVLCDLEGRSQKEAAAQLGCPEGTLSSRLTRARELLRTRLARRGITISTGTLALAFAQQSASACVPSALLQSTAQMAALLSTTTTAATAGIVSPQVAALTEGVIKTMFFAQLKPFVIAASVFVAAIGAYQMSAAESNDAQNESSAGQGEQSDEKTQQVLKELEGKWKLVSKESRGRVRNVDGDNKVHTIISFSTDSFTISNSRSVDVAEGQGTLRINARNEPYEIDM
ncbi:MAG: sigma-70 family RNA polymerase sigma factor, partial [Planctomycetaceae bacterium]|nr:sigma-70 family RNA polymerase sigma factor [Planctomycetaceae bacterium]